MTRYVVTEVEGWRSIGIGAGKPGLSVHVLDVAFNHRVVFTARSEQYSTGPGHTHAGGRADARAAAATRCDLLNRLDEIAREAQGAVA